MKIVIAGAGSVGSHLAKMLSLESHDIIIMDESADRLNRVAEEADVITIQGSSTSLDTLRKAGIDKADLFIAVSPAEEQDVNIVSALLAKKMGAKKVTARINNEEYQTSDNKFIFTELGIDSLFYPEKIVSKEILNLLKETSTSEYMDYSHGKLQLIAIKLDEDSMLIDQKVNALSNKENLFRTVAINRDDDTIIPKVDTKYKVDDMVYVISKKEGITKAMQALGRENVMVNNLMIVGGGRIAEMVAREAENTIPNIKIIEYNKKKSLHLSQILNKSLVINGDCRDADVLIEENVKDMDAFVAVTGSSEANIMSCVTAKKMGVPKVIAEVENFDYIKLAEGMGVDSVINKKLITAGRIFRFTLSNNIRSIKILNGTQAEVLEFIVTPDSKIASSKLADINFPLDAIIGGVIRGDESFIPNDDSIINAYDQVIVFADPKAINKVDKFFL